MRSLGSKLSIVEDGTPENAGSTDMQHCIGKTTKSDTFCKKNSKTLSKSENHRGGQENHAFPMIFAFFTKQPFPIFSDFPDSSFYFQSCSTSLVPDDPHDSCWLPSTISSGPGVTFYFSLYFLQESYFCANIAFGIPTRANKGADW